MNKSSQKLSTTDSNLQNKKADGADDSHIAQPLTNSKKRKADFPTMIEQGNTKKLKI